LPQVPEILKEQQRELIDSLDLNQWVCLIAFLFLFFLLNCKCGTDSRFMIAVIDTR
jgi:hypothetical protein